MNCHLSEIWSSPYQQEIFHQVLLDSGIYSLRLPSLGDYLFAYRINDENLSAWEVSKPYDKNLSEIVTIWSFQGRSKYNQTNWNTSSYYTAVVDKASVQYSGNCARNINKAIKHNLRHGIIDNNQQRLNSLLSLFLSRDETRSHIEFNTFSRLVTSLLDARITKVHYVENIHKEVLAVAVVILSNSVANIRFVTSRKEYLELRPVNLLYHEIITHYLESDYVVDLSGIETALSENRKLLNINKFKLGYTQQIIEFSSNFKV
jgi:hypothetical protein